jgi:hypothetical protein
MGPRFQSEVLTQRPHRVKKDSRSPFLGNEIEHSFFDVATYQGNETVRARRRIEVKVFLWKVSEERESKELGRFKR